MGDWISLKLSQEYCLIHNHNRLFQVVIVTIACSIPLEMTGFSFFAIIIFLLMNVYSLSAINFFALLVLLAYEGLGVTAKSIRRSTMRCKLQKRWREYVVISEFVLHINQSFRFILVTDITISFISCVTNFFLHSFKLKSDDDFPFYVTLAYMMMNMNRILIATYVVSIIQRRVSISVNISKPYLKDKHIDG